MLPSHPSRILVDVLHSFISRIRMWAKRKASRTQEVSNSTVAQETPETKVLQYEDTTHCLLLTCSNMKFPRYSSSKNHRNGVGSRILDPEVKGDSPNSSERS